MVCSKECEERSAEVATLMIQDLGLLLRTAVKLVMLFVRMIWQARVAIAVSLLVVLIVGIAGGIAPVQDPDLEANTARFTTD
jgi:uncharacterized membrane-anchored protein